jgi:hypothetical protein
MGEEGSGNIESIMMVLKDEWSSLLLLLAGVSKGQREALLF